MALLLFHLVKYSCMLIGLNRIGIKYVFPDLKVKVSGMTVVTKKDLHRALEFCL